jgi:hypothetical protein
MGIEAGIRAYNFGRGHQHLLLRGAISCRPPAIDSLGSRIELSTESRKTELLLLPTRDELVRAMSFVAIPALIGPRLGPVPGGLIVGCFHWRLISS